MSVIGRKVNDGQAQGRSSGETEWKWGNSLILGRQ